MFLNANSLGFKIAKPRVDSPVTLASSSEETKTVMKFARNAMSLDARNAPMTELAQPVM